jgi:hypothetical protein
MTMDTVIRDARLQLEAAARRLKHLEGGDVPPRRYNALLGEARALTHAALARCTDRDEQEAR